MSSDPSLSGFPASRGSRAGNHAIIALAYMIFLALFAVNLIYFVFVLWDLHSCSKWFCIPLEAGVTAFLAWFHLTSIALRSTPHRPPSRRELRIRFVMAGATILWAVAAWAWRSDTFVPFFGLTQIFLVTLVGRLAGPRGGASARRWRTAARAGFVPAILLLVVLLELMNRTWYMGLYRPDPRFIVTLRANGLYHVNRAGFRGPDLSPQKPVGMRRILFLGDSSTFGLGVRWDETFAERAASCLAAREGVPVEAINAGVPGYNLRNMVDRWEELERYGPDATVVMAGYHFRAVRAQLERQQALEARFRRIGPVLKKLERIGITFLTPPAIYAMARAAWETGPDNTSDRLDLAAYEAVLRDLAALSERTHVPIVFVAYPADLIEPLAQSAIAHFANERGIPVVDPRPVFRPEDRMADELHPLASGHAKIAALLCGQPEIRETIRNASRSPFP